MANLLVNTSKLLILIIWLQKYWRACSYILA